MTTYDTPLTPEQWICMHCKRPRIEHACTEGFRHERISFAGMLRVRNEARWIREVIESIRPLCDRIYVMDDHSTDKTPQIVEDLKWGIRLGVHYEQVTLLPSPFEGLNEARDKNWLYDQILRECEPQWILCIDGDEVLERNGPELIREACRTRYDASFRLKIEFMWNDPQHVRTDRVYSDFWRPSLFRPYIPDPDKPDNIRMAEEFRFKATPFGRHVDGNQPNLHCSSVPQRRIHGSKAIPVRLKHYGYMERAARVAKLDYYTSIDWKNDAEDWYRHMCQGDVVKLDEIPKAMALVKRGTLELNDVWRIIDVGADEELLHAGPLKIEEWKEDALWQMTEYAKAL